MNRKISRTAIFAFIVFLEVQSIYCQDFPIIPAPPVTPPPTMPPLPSPLPDPVPTPVPPPDPPTAAPADPAPSH
jgi:hypothetical protein